MQLQSSPYRCHVFICVNDRQGARKSCADGGAVELGVRLKERVRQHPGLQGCVRVSTCGCLGLCADGPNVLLHPPGRWCCGVGAGDLERVLAEIEACAGLRNGGGSATGGEAS